MSEADERVVLDASAVLALLRREPGAEVVRTFLHRGVLGAVNLAEVLTKLEDDGMPAASAMRSAGLLLLPILPFTQRLAQRAAALRVLTRRAGLSLGDRACLALAADFGAPALTSDRRWTQIAEAVGVQVQLIR